MEKLLEEMQHDHPTCFSDATCFTISNHETKLKKKAAVAAAEAAKHALKNPVIPVEVTEDAANDSHEVIDKGGRPKGSTIVAQMDYEHRVQEATSGHP